MKKERNKYLITNGTSWTLQDIKHHFDFSNRLVRAEGIRSLIQNSLDILSLPHHGTEVSAVVSFPQGSGRFSTKLWIDPADPKDIVFTKSNGPLAKMVLDFDAISTKNISRIVGSPKAVIDDLEAQLFNLSGRLTEYITIAEDRESFSLSHEIGHLLTEYQSLIDQVVDKHLKTFELFFSVPKQKYTPDLRLFLRRICHFLFKSIPISGCDDEEAGLTHSMVKHNLFILKIRSSCYTILNPYLPRLIPLSNLRMTG